jgi:hypothetical protein
MVKVVVIMDKVGHKPVAVCFKEQEKDMEKLLELVGGTYKSYEVSFWLAGEGNLMSEAAKVLDERRKRDEDMQGTQQQQPGLPPGLGLPGFP